MNAHTHYYNIPSKHTHSIKAKANPGKGGKATLHMYLTLPCSAYHLWFSFCGQNDASHLSLGTSLYSLQYTIHRSFFRWLTSSTRVCIVLTRGSRVVFIAYLPVHVRPSVVIYFSGVLCFLYIDFVVCLLLFFVDDEASLLCIAYFAFWKDLTFYCYALYSLHSSTGSDLELTTMDLNAAR